MLDTYGTGNFTFGYFGSVMDAATGLLYVGNGQYYDPETGRFLTRDVNPDSTNPYVPWNPQKMHDKSCKAVYQSNRACADY